jgi:hypothetical protein
LKPLALGAAALAGAVALAACAKHVAPAPPEGQDYLFSAPAAGELPAADAAALQTAWREVLAGDTKAAIKHYEKLLRRQAQGGPCL